MAPRAAAHGQAHVWMNQSLDGYVEHEAFVPDEVLFGRFTELTRELAGSL